MSEGEWMEWGIAPVLEGLCKYESLKDGTLDLFDIERMNEALGVKAENTYRLREVMQREADAARGRR
jgi:hypothetical protein